MGFYFRPWNANRLYNATSAKMASNANGASANASCLIRKYIFKKKKESFSYLSENKDCFRAVKKSYKTVSTFLGPF